MLVIGHSDPKAGFQRNLALRKRSFRRVPQPTYIKLTTPKDVSIDFITLTPFQLVIPNPEVTPTTGAPWLRQCCDIWGLAISPERERRWRRMQDFEKAIRAKSG